jgi:hypothetical protein
MSPVSCLAQASRQPIQVQKASYDYRDRAQAQQSEVLSASVRKTVTGAPPYDPTAGMVNICIPFKNVSDKAVAVVDWQINFLDASGNVTHTESASSTGTFATNALISCVSDSPAVVAVPTPGDHPAFRVSVAAVKYADGTIQSF